MFVTRYRRGAFTTEILDHCRQIMADVCTDFDAELLEFGGEDDHVHLLVAYPAKVPLTKLINSLKGVSARLLRKTHHDHLSKYLWGGHLWSRSYYAGTTGGANLSTVAAYVNSQRTPAT